MRGEANPDFMPRRPQFVRVELDADMVSEGPLRGGRWPHRERVLTYHYFGARKLKRGDRVCVCAGLYRDAFGTVLGRSFYRGYSYRVRRTKLKTITVQRPAQIEVEVA